MSEYILRNEACHELREIRCCDMTDKWGQGYNAGITEAIDRINNFIPTADVAPVVHGYWKANKKLYMPECSVCEARPFKGYIPSMDDVKKTYKYCPNCGAKMDESGDTE